MVNYYEELGLDRSLGLDELNRQLSRAESVWKARRTRAPEKATKMLAIIVDAREAFSTQESRTKYDATLATSPEEEPVAPMLHDEIPRMDWWKLAFESWQVQDWQMALSHAEAGLRENPSEARLWQLKADVLRRTGDLLGAVGAARQRLARAQDDADAHWDLAQTLVRVATPNFEYDSAHEREMCEACNEYQQAVRIGGDRYATDVAQCFAYLGDWSSTLAWAVRALAYNAYDEYANMYFSIGVVADAESKLSGGTTITNRKQLDYAKTAVRKIHDLELSACNEATLSVIRDQERSLQDRVDEAEHVEWHGFRYGQMSGYEYAARTLPKALVRSGLQ